jgi:hypothetical protein
MVGAVALAVEPASTTVILEAHAARQRFWEHSGTWSAIWSDCGNGEYTALTHTF